MDNWESKFDDTRRAKSGGTADAPSMTRDQQDQNADMGAASVSQRPHFSSVQDLGIGEEVNLSKDEMAAEFKSHIEKLNAKYIDLDQKLQDNNQKKQELKLRHEQQQNTLLQYQMNLEQLSTRYDTEMKGRDTLVINLQRNNHIIKTFEEHCQRVSDALNHMVSDNGNISNKYSDCLQSLSSEENKFKALRDQLEETKNLQDAVQEQKKLHQHYDDVYKVKREHALGEHIQKMSKINEAKAQTDRRIEEMKEKLALVRSKTANLRENEIRMSQMREEEISGLISERDNLKMLKEGSENAVCSAQRERAHLTTKLKEKETELRHVSESIPNLEANHKELEKRREILAQELADNQAKKDNLSKQVLGLDEQNIQLSIHQEELRTKLEDLRRSSSSQIMEQKKQLEDILLMSSERKSGLQQEITALDLQCISKFEKCKELKQKASDVNVKLTSLMEANASLVSMSESLKTEAQAKQTEKQKLVFEVEEVSEFLNIEKTRVSESESSLKQLKEESENKVKVLCDDLEKIKTIVLTAHSEQKAKRAHEASVKHNLQQVKENIDQTDQQIKANHDCAILKLEEKIAYLENLKKQMTLEDQKIISKLEDDESHKNQQLRRKEEELLELEKHHQILVNEIESKKKVLITLKNDDGEMERKIQELTLQAQITVEELRQKETGLKELNMMLQEERHTLQSKFDKVSELKQEVMRTERETAETISEHNRQREELLGDISTTKQTCESLSSKHSTLNTELNELKKFHAECLKIVEVSEKSISNHEEEIKNNNLEIEKNANVIRQLIKDYEANQRSIQQSKKETELANKIYLKLRSGIAAAKAKKSNKENALKIASTSTQAEGQSAEKFDEPETQCGSSAGTPHTRQCTPHSDIKEVTPRSILKTSKSPTPKQEIKRVSFFERENSDGIESSSSVILEPADFAEITGNKSTLVQIAQRKKKEMAAKNLEMKGQQSSHGQQ